MRGHQPRCKPLKRPRLGDDRGRTPLEPGRSSFVECPICTKSVPFSTLNMHLDSAQCRSAVAIAHSRQPASTHAELTCREAANAASGPDGCQLASTSREDGGAPLEPPADPDSTAVRRIDVDRPEQADAPSGSPGGRSCAGADALGEAGPPSDGSGSPTVDISCLTRDAHRASCSPADRSSPDADRRDEAGGDDDATRQPQRAATSIPAEVVRRRGASWGPPALSGASMHRRAERAHARAHARLAPFTQHVRKMPRCHCAPTNPQLYRP